ncbi:DNA alkylation repair protein [Peribacillus saganii]|uniref:DNA alkylation repair protein n=1 Tax=Peribacillus saganii TaxID=2303992 RepID=UPI0022776F58|nr:DNA alkylation repair protein [Peribacillus saganii]
MKESEQLFFLFEANRNRENAGPMSAYMKNHFPFLGIKSPDRRILMTQFFRDTGILKKPFSEAFVRELWSYPERELQYAAMDYMMKYAKKLEKGYISLLKELIEQKSWWDSVDAIASNLVGSIAAKYPELMDEYIEHWSKHENMWLRRTAILFQLKYKEKTDEERLYRYILRNADSGEFFIQKSIGWALREYSKTNPESVRAFIESHSLAKLSVREGSKYI